MHSTPRDIKKTSAPGQQWDTDSSDHDDENTWNQLQLCNDFPDCSALKLLIWPVQFLKKLPHTYSPSTPAWSCWICSRCRRSRCPCVDHAIADADEAQIYVNKSHTVKARNICGWGGLNTLIWSKNGQIIYLYTNSIPCILWIKKSQLCTSVLKKKVYFCTSLWDFKWNNLW